MSIELIDTILKTTQAKSDKEGYSALPEGTTLTLYVARGGATLQVPRIEAVKTEGEFVFARTAKRELFLLSRADIYAASSEGAIGAPVRRAGFG
jgi:hypothetical protein